MPGRDTATLAHAAAGHFGSAAVRLADFPGHNSHRDNRAETLVLEPDQASIVGDMLRWADDERLAIVPSGSGTKLTWGASASKPDAVLSTARLSTPIEHCAGDLTATLPAGVSLGAVNRALGLERQWLTLDPPYTDRATVGGIIATNDSGPRRHRFGAPRDLILGVEMALVDGRHVKAGGRVVKNVAGYDLSRLLCGSHGSLAVITSATFKLSPVAPASRTVVLSAPDFGTLNRLTRAITEAPLTPSTCELESPPARLLIRFETTKAAAEHQSAAAASIAERGGASAAVLSGDAEMDVWRAHESGLWTADGTLLKLAVLPSDVWTMLEQTERLIADRAVGYRAGGRAALGVVFVRLSGHVEAHASIIAELRHRVAKCRGSVVMLTADSSVRAAVDPWGDIGDALPMMRSVKARFDPNRTLSPGRGPGGI
jgi:glycolate oxidase FAD binding subunit